MDWSMLSLFFSLQFVQHQWFINSTFFGLCIDYWGEWNWLHDIRRNNHYCRMKIFKSINLMKFFDFSVLKPFWGLRNFQLRKKDFDHYTIRILEWEYVFWIWSICTFFCRWNTIRISQNNALYMNAVESVLDIRQAEEMTDDTGGMNTSCCDWERKMDWTLNHWMKVHIMALSSIISINWLMTAIYFVRERYLGLPQRKIYCWSSGIRTFV